MSFDKEINHILQIASLMLPEAYELRISIVHNEASISLYGPDGNDIEVCTDDLDFKGCIAQHVGVALDHKEESNHETI